MTQGTDPWTYYPYQMKVKDPVSNKSGLCKQTDLWSGAWMQKKQLDSICQTSFQNKKTTHHEGLTDILGFKYDLTFRARIHMHRTSCFRGGTFMGWNIKCHCKNSNPCIYFILCKRSREQLIYGYGDLSLLQTSPMSHSAWWPAAT